MNSRNIEHSDPQASLPVTQETDLGCMHVQEFKICNWREISSQNNRTEQAPVDSEVQSQVFIKEHSLDKMVIIFSVGL